MCLWQSWASIFATTGCFHITSTVVWINKQSGSIKEVLLLVSHKMYPCCFTYLSSAVILLLYFKTSVDYVGRSPWSWCLKIAFEQYTVVAIDVFQANDLNAIPT